MSGTTDRFNGYVASLAFKVPCVVATTANITLVGTQTIEGYALETGDRVLVTSQTDPIENGIWKVTSSDWVREPDFDGRRDATFNSLVVAGRLSPASAAIFNVDTATPFIIGEDSISISLYLDPDAAGGAEVNDLTASVTWDDIPDANVPESAVTQHGAALTIVEGQITGAEFSNWNTAFGWGDHAGLYSLTSHTHLLAVGATDVTATAAEVNLLDLSGLTAGWVLSADTATTASWKAQAGGSQTPWTSDIDGAGYALSDVGLITQEDVGAIPTGSAATGTYYTDTQTWQSQYPGFTNEDDQSFILSDFHGINYTFSTLTGAADPGVGFIRFDAAMASATNIYVDNVDHNGHTNFNQWQRLAIGDVIVFRNGSDRGANWQGEIDGTPVNNGGWWTIPVNTTGASGTFGNSEAVQLVHHRTGDVGAVAQTITATWSTGSGGQQTYQSGATQLIEDGAILEIEESASMADPSAGYGRVWVRDDAPNVLMFTDDDGDDFVVSGSAVQIKRCTTDTTRNANTTLQDVTGLTGFVLEAGASYAIEGSLQVVSNAAAGHKFAFTFTDTEQDSHASYHQVTTGGGRTARGSVAISTGNIVVATDTSQATVSISGYFQANASTGGTMAFQMAQFVSTAVDTTVYVGSWIRITKIS